MRRRLEYIFPMATAIVEPTNSNDLRACVRAAVKLGAAFTLRGAGTGSLGGVCVLVTRALHRFSLFQASATTPSIIVDLSKYLLDEIEIDSQRGIVSCSAGASIFSVREATLRMGWDLRIYPSTIPQNGCIGGFLSNYPWGVGSLTYGSMQAPGNVIGLDVISVDKDATAVELHHSFTPSNILASFVGAQGTIGVISKVHLALSPAASTTSAVFSFSDIRFVTANFIANAFV